MKKILRTIICLFLTLSVHAQEGLTVLLGTEIPYDYKKGVYLKDINNVITPYLGTWEGTLSGKKYTFVFQKFLKIRSGSLENFYNYSDCIVAKFKVVDVASSTTLYTSMNATSIDDFPIFGIPIGSDNYMEFIFYDTDANCRNCLEFYFKKIAGNPNQMQYLKYKYGTDARYPDDPCSYANRADIPVFLPPENLILTKL